MTLPTPTPLSAGGGGGGGLTAESDPTGVWYDPVAEIYFTKTIEYDDAGVFAGYDDRNLAGAAITPDASSYPAVSLVGGPDATVTVTRVTTGNSPFSSAAGNAATHYIVIADAVTVEAVAVPANTGHTFEVPGRTVPAIDFTADATGDVLVIEEAA